MVSFAHIPLGTIIKATAFKTLGSGNITFELLITGLLSWVPRYLTNFIPHRHFFRGPVNFSKFITWILTLALGSVCIIFLALVLLLQM